jgi:hypothetical protein
MVVQDGIKADLIALFKLMETSPMSFETYSEKWSTLLAKHILTAEVPAGSVVVAVVGEATGTMNAAAIPVE